MDALLAAIVTWLSINAGLPATYDFPEVGFASEREIALIHLQELTPEERQNALAVYDSLPEGERRSVVAVYDTRRRKIVLPEGWLGRSPAELSMLVHEMAHYLQAEAGLRYACSEEREKVAYAAQEKWLADFNTTLQKEFQIDRLTLFVSTTCSF
jgi:hypothetical protein